MTFLKVRNFLHNLFSFRRVEVDLDQEVHSHLEMLTEENIRVGMPPKEAQRAARIELGGVEQVKEQVREERLGNWFRSVLSDCHYGLRQLRKNPLFTSIAMLTLALGIGASTAIFSVIEAVLLRPLPYKDPARLVLLANPQDPEDGGVSYKDFENWKLQSQTFENMAVYYRDSGWSRVTLATAREPESVQGAFVSSNFFTLMGVSPSLGRMFTFEEERRAERVVILSYGLWVRGFGGSTDVLGKTLQIDGISSQVIGVMPVRFRFPARDQQFWAPITTNRWWNDPDIAHNDPNRSDGFYSRWQVIGRLKETMTLQQAQAEMATLCSATSRSTAETGRGNCISLVPLRTNVSGNIRLSLLVLFSAVVFLLLIACSNVANLVLARAVDREREMAVRIALGASRNRLVRQLLTENSILALLAGFFGLMIADAGLRILISFAPSDIPRIEEASLDGFVLCFTMTISLLTAIIFGLAPIFGKSLSDPNKVMKSGSSRWSTSVAYLRGARNILVILEFSLAVLLLTGSGLLARSFLAIQALDLGFQPKNALTMTVSYPVPAGTAEARRSAFYDLALQRIRTLPGVESAGAMDTLFDLGKLNSLGLRTIEGRAPEPKESWTPLAWNTVRGDCLQALGVQLLAGRYFTDQDGPDSPLVAIIDESFARRYWPGESPIGKRFKGQDSRGHNDDWLTVVGVVKDMRRNGRERNPIPHVFEWYKQAASDVTPEFIIRTTDTSQRVKIAFRSAVRELDGDVILSPVTTLEDSLSEQLSSRRFQTWLVSFFSGIALLLAIVGIYGVMHYSVAQRTNEIGIRMALGAQGNDVLHLVLMQGERLAFLGIAIGVLFALLVTPLMAKLLYGVSPIDPVTFASTAALLCFVALVASYIPARRASRVDPIVALRYE